MRAEDLDLLTPDEVHAFCGHLSHRYDAIAKKNGVGEVSLLQSCA